MSNFSNYPPGVTGNEPYLTGENDMECSVQGCEGLTTGIMCLTHWERLPREVQRALYDAPAYSEKYNKLRDASIALIEALEL